MCTFSEKKEKRKKIRITSEPFVVQLTFLRSRAVFSVKNTKFDLLTNFELYDFKKLVEIVVCTGKSQFKEPRFFKFLIKQYLMQESPM